MGLTSKVTASREKWMRERKKMKKQGERNRREDGRAGESKGR